MSVRAHRINEIKYADSATWNLWNQQYVLDFLDGDDDTTDFRNMDGAGRVEVPVASLEKLVKKLEQNEMKDDDGKEIDEVERKDLIESLKKDIEWANRVEEDYILYDCF